MHEDDHIGRILSQIDPATTPQADRLTPRQEGIRDRIKGGGRAVTTSHVARRNRFRFATVALVATAIVVAVAVLPGLLRPSAAVAITPPPLEYTQIDMTPEEVLEFATLRLRDGRGPVEPSRVVDYIGWYFSIEDLDTAEPRVSITPQVVSSEWNEDLSGRVTVIAGEPNLVDGRNDVPVPSGGEAPGTILSDVRYSAGEFFVPEIEPPGRVESELFETLRLYGVERQPTTFDLIVGVKNLMTLWSLTDEQHVALLNLIFSADDVEVFGVTEDRAGRSVLGIGAERTEADGGGTVALISTETGRVVAHESYFTVPMHGLPTGSVFEYTLWEVTE